MANSFKKNFSILTMGELCARAIGMFTNIILARYLAPEGYGQYTLVLTYVAILYSLSCLGVNQLTIRYIARNQNDSCFYLKLSLLFRGVGFILSAVGFYIYAIFSKVSFDDNIIFCVILASVFLENIWMAFQNVAFGMQRMEWNSIINVLFAAINLCIYLILPSQLINVKVVLLVYVLVYICKDIAYFISLSRSHLLQVSNSSLSIDRNICITFFKESMPFYVLMVFGLLTNQLPTIFLERNSTIEEVAYFGTANKLLLPLTIFMNTALTALFPNQSQLFVQDREKFQRKTIDIITILTAFGIFLSFIISLFRWEVVSILYGDKYLNTANVMAYQCWYFVLYSLFCVNGVTLGAADEQRKLAICSIVYGIISTPILYYASFKGAQGLSIGYIIASIINLSYILLVLRRVLNNMLTVKYILLYLAIMIACIILCSSISSELLLQYRIAIFVFVVSLIVLYRKRLLLFIKM